MLLVDATDRVLLLRGRDPAQPTETYWFTPGGGIEGGETAAQAAARELREETGLAVLAEQLGAPVFVGVAQFSFAGRRYRQQQEFYFHRVAAWQPTAAGLDVVEHATIDAYRWWSADELEATREPYYPAELAQELRRLLALAPDAGHARGGSA